MMDEYQLEDERRRRAYRRHVFHVVVVAVLCHLLWWASGCGGPQGPEPIRVIHVDRSCLDDAKLRPPPAPPPDLELSDPGFLGILYEFCADRPNAAALLDLLKRARRWMLQAEAACRRKPDPEEGEP